MACVHCVPWVSLSHRGKLRMGASPNETCSCGYHAMPKIDRRLTDHKPDGKGNLILNTLAVQIAVVVNASSC